MKYNGGIQSCMLLNDSREPMPLIRKKLNPYMYLRIKPHLCPANFPPLWRYRGITPDKRPWIKHIPKLS